MKCTFTALDKGGKRGTYQWLSVFEPRSRGDWLRHWLHGFTPSDGFQMCWPHITYFNLRAEAFSEIHWAMGWPAVVLPPYAVTIKSVAIPIQCSLLPEHVRLHPISRIFPGNWATILFAPLIAVCWHPALPKGGELGGVGVPLGIQHLKVEGPGHWLVSVTPEAHVLLKRQLPALPLPQAVLVQHLMSAGSLGQAPLMDVPPPREQDDVEMQVPGAPPAPVQGPFKARATRGEVAIVKGVLRARRKTVLESVCILFAGVTQDCNWTMEWMMLWKNSRKVKYRSLYTKKSNASTGETSKSPTLPL